MDYDLLPAALNKVPKSSLIEKEIDDEQETYSQGNHDN
jgi:hypothetical protein